MTTSRLLGAIALTCAGLSAAGPPLAAQSSDVVGTLSVVWADGPDGRPPSVLTFFAPDAGASREIVLNDADIERLGGVTSLNGRRVRATFNAALDVPRAGRPLTASSVADVSVQRDADAPAAGRSTPPLVVAGAVRYVVLLCKYTDSTLLVSDPLTHYTAMFGNTSPGLDHYWRALSFGAMNLTGSRVEGWFDMPGAWADYWDQSTRSLRIDRVAQDCATAADGLVDFSQFEGVVFITPPPQGRIPGPGFGGGTSLVVDGARRSFRAAWIPFEVCGRVGCYGLTVVSHEIGHSLGLPHSSGPYGATYDSEWDVMSGTRYEACVPGATYGCVGQGTIGYHKSLLGWIPSARSVNVGRGTTDIELLPLDTLPTAGPGVLLATLAVPGTSTFYTVEARRPMGYDSPLRRNTVLIHHVDPARSSQSPAWVVDGTNTDPAKNPNDDEAMWVAGEAFVDAAAGILVEVLDETAAGWRVALTSHAPGLPLARRDAYVVTTNVPLTMATPGVLGNDVATSGGSLAASLVASPLHGTLALAPTGGFTYTPVAGYIGPDSFTYSASNGAGTSNTTTVTLTVTTAPQPPASLTVDRVVGNTVTLRWTPPAGGPTPTSYVMEGGVAPGQTLAAIPTGSASPVFTFAAPNGAFYLRVRTVAGAQTSTASNEIRVFVNQPVAPSAPAGLAGMVNGQQVALSWRNTFGGGAPNNVVLDVTGALAVSLPLGLVDTFTFPNVPVGTYTFSVRAVNAAGSSAASNPVTLTFPGVCSGAPAAPTNFLAYSVGNTLHLMWEPAASGAATTSYVLNVAGAYNGALPFATPGLSTPVPPGSYTFSVTATNACGASASTAPQTVVVP